MWWLVVLLLCVAVLDIIVKLISTSTSRPTISTSTSRPTDDLSSGTHLAGEG